MKMLHRIPWFFVFTLATAAAQTPPRVLTVPAGAVTGKTASEPGRANVEPVILTRTSLDEKVVALRLAPRIATSIRMPEPVNSVVVGDPENFQAEHSEREPELVTVKPATDQPAQTNLLITTTLGHQLNLVLVTAGEQNTGIQVVDVLLTYGKPKSGSFLVEESAFPTSLVAETTRLGSETRALQTTIGPGGPTMTQLVNLLKPATTEAPQAAEDTSGQGLDKLLERQRRAPLPTLYGQRPGESRPGRDLRRESAR